MLLKALLTRLSLPCWSAWVKDKQAVYNVLETGEVSQPTARSAISFQPSAFYRTVLNGFTQQMTLKCGVFGQCAN